MVYLIKAKSSRASHHRFQSLSSSILDPTKFLDRRSLAHIRCQEKRKVAAESSNTNMETSSSYMHIKGSCRHVLA
uniref:Uncharacterized protein n=1 Tax=Kalanchoe fedtschenkoi TaxID=63787 RepID=A0A7N0UUH4_KALFE